MLAAMPRSSSAFMAARRLFSSTPHGVTTVGVVGLGLMGHGIAQTAAEKGYSVVAVELEERFLAGGLKRVDDSVTKLAAKAVKKGKMDEAAAAAHREAVMGRITATTDRAALASGATTRWLVARQKSFVQYGSCCPVFTIAPTTPGGEGGISTSSQPSP